MRYQERIIMLQVLDTQWKDHLWALDHLKEGIGLRGYGQRDPLIEYKKESFSMFEEMNSRREEETVRYLYLFEPISREQHEARRRSEETKLVTPRNRIWSTAPGNPRQLPVKKEAAKVVAMILTSAAAGRNSRSVMKITSRLRLAGHDIPIERSYGARIAV
jgi:preprotein translocase subunit SecA